MAHTTHEINFQKSFFFWQTHEGSIGRFSIESICQINSPDKTTTFFLLAGVLACNVYGTGRLISDPPYLFQALFGASEFKIFRDYFGTKTDDNTVQKISGTFSSVKEVLSYSESALLERYSDIEEAVMTNKNIIAAIKIKHNGNCIELVFPVKHINIERKKQLFQVETGWVTMPANAFNKNLNTGSFEKGFIAFNQQKEFEFVFSEEYTKEETVSKIFFSKYVRQTAEISLFAQK